MNVDDMCFDYELKFKIKFNKLRKGDYQLGLFLSQEQFENYYRKFKERYIYICLFKWSITIGFII